jgi:hypothetical protein
MQSQIELAAGLPRIKGFFAEQNTRRAWATRWLVGDAQKNGKKRADADNHAAVSNASVKTYYFNFVWTCFKL